MNTKNKLQISALIIGLITFAGTASGATLKVGPSQNYNTIQSAVDNASFDDTVEIFPGNYTEDVDVDVEGLTLTSNQSKESVLLNGRISVQAPNVTVEGLSITNPDGGPESFIGVTVANGIAADAGSNTDGMMVRNNHIFDIGNDLNATTLSDGAGVLLFGTNDAVVEENTIESVRGGSEPDQYRGAKGVHLADSGSDTSNVTVRANDISDIRNFGTSNDGVGILVFTGGFEDIEILENDVRGIEGGAGSAISVGTNVFDPTHPRTGTDLSIMRNTVDNATSYRQPDNKGEGVVLFGGVDASTVEVNRNNLLTDIGVINGFGITGEIDATENYWGAASGPAARTNPAGKQIGKGGEVIGNVDWTSYLVKPFDQTPVQTPAAPKRGP